MYNPPIRTTYTEPTQEPNGCSINVPSGMPIYISDGRGAIDVQDAGFRSPWTAMCRNAPKTIDDPDREVGSVLLSDGVHRIFMTHTHCVYVDGNIY